MRASATSPLHVSTATPAPSGGSTWLSLAMERQHGWAQLRDLPRSRYWLAATFASVVLLLSLVSLPALADGPDLGAGLSPQEDGAQAVSWVMAGGYAAEAGLRAGDVVRFVPVLDGLAGAQAVQVLSGVRAGQTVVFTRRWAPAIGVLLLLLGLEFLVVGLLVFLKASDRSAARRFAALAGTIAVTLVAFPAIAIGHPWALSLEWFGSKAGMAAFVFFFLTVPTRRWEPLRRLFLWAPVPILTFYCYSVFSRPDLYSFVKTAGYSYMAGGIAISIVAMLLPLLTRCPRPQRRLWPVALGSGLAGAIYLLGSVLPFLLFHSYLLTSEVATLGLGFVPLGFAWAMLRYPVMGVSLGPWAVIKTVFESISDPIFVVGRDGRLVDASRAGLELLGIEKAKQARKPFWQLAGSWDLAPSSASILPSLEPVLSGEAVHDAELALQLPTGETTYMSVDGTPLCDEQGQVVMAVLVFRNITERKLREIAQRDLERQKEEFLASISHDLRAPLTVIKYSAGVVLANEPAGFPEPLHRMLGNVDRAADRMASMIDDLLELAHLQAGQVQLRLDRYDLRDVATRAATAVEPLAVSRGQRLRLELPAMPILADVDGARLERVLTNLLGNAHKYGNEGGNICLRLAPGASEILFAVSDDGPGIPEAEQERIFERFYRVDGRCGPGNGGSGLGLPIARTMVELHGGRLWVESQPGAGSTFWVALPVAPTIEVGA